MRIFEQNVFLWANPSAKNGGLSHAPTTKTQFPKAWNTKLSDVVSRRTFTVGNPMGSNRFLGQRERSQVCSDTEDLMERSLLTIYLYCNLSSGILSGQLERLQVSSDTEKPDGALTLNDLFLFYLSSYRLKRLQGLERAPGAK